VTSTEDQSGRNVAAIRVDASMSVNNRAIVPLRGRSESSMRRLTRARQSELSSAECRRFDVRPVVSTNDRDERPP
jgi:hypothetical protein